MNLIVISIADEFSLYPAGRVPADGPDNGKTFREKILLPKLREAMEAGKKLTVSLDGVLSCGSSFLDSSFGGLIKYDGMRRKDIEKVLDIRFTKPSLERYKLAIERSLLRAKPQS